MTTPSQYDGYKGAGDAANLGQADLDDDVAHVENQHYHVRVITDKFNRLQIAPV